MRVVAVVSAMGNATNRLLAAAQAVTPAPPDALVGPLLATGEDASVALLLIALFGAGVDAEGATASRIPVRTKGCLLDADPVEVDVEALVEVLRRRQVLVVPGFVGVDMATGAPSLLGRGGSDLTALFLGQALRAVSVRLLKDVDGIFPADPKRVKGLSAFTRANWEAARRFGGGVVQEKALNFASRHALGFRVGAVGGVGTRVGPANGDDC